MDNWITSIHDTFKNPETCTCAVVCYVYHHQNLSIEIREAPGDDNNEPYYLNFQAVKYYAGRLSWTGALFQRCSPDICLELVRHLGHLSTQPDELAIQAYTLYETRSVPTVRILVMGKGEGILVKENYAKAWILGK